MKRRIWFERAFEFPALIESFPDVVERLRGTPARLEERLGKLPVDILTMRSGESWSIQEHAGHLKDLEPLWFGRIEDLLAGVAQLRAADLTNTATWDACHNDREVDSILKEFRRRRADFVLKCEALEPADLRRSALHPRLELPMTVVDLGGFVVEHDDHHLAAISALLGGATD